MNIHQLKSIKVQCVRMFCSHCNNVINTPTDVNVHVPWSDDKSALQNCSPSVRMLVDPPIASNVYQCSVSDLAQQPEVGWVWLTPTILSVGDPQQETIGRNLQVLIMSEGEVISAVSNLLVLSTHTALEVSCCVLWKTPAYSC